MKTHHTIYDIVFSGFGASSCILINQLHKKKELDNKRILILDPSEKKSNDKTFCFWANPDDDIVLDYQQVLTHSWSKVNIDTSKTSEITPFKYHHLNSEGLYQLTKNILKGYDVTFSNEIIERIDENTVATLWTKENRYTAQLVFDSRPPKTTKNLSKKQNI